MKRKSSLNESMKKTHAEKATDFKSYSGNDGMRISTGSTLLDLAIAGQTPAIPGGIFVEIFGQSGTGKTVLLSEIAADIKRKGGSVRFNDPEGRLNAQFASIFDLDVDEIELEKPDTVKELFVPIHKWAPNTPDAVNGIMADSLAALSTDLEMDNDEGDKMGMKRAKEFSEQLRKVARLLVEKNYLMVASNQVRVNADAGMFGQKYIAPGGKAIEFYASLRLRVKGIKEKLKKKRKIKGVEHEEVYGITIEIEVAKSSIDKPYRTALVTIIFDYGIDDIRENLKFLKKNTKATTYELGGESLDRSLEKAISIVEEEGLEEQLKNEVIELWHEIQNSFESNRKKKQR